MSSRTKPVAVGSIGSLDALFRAGMAGTGVGYLLTGWQAVAEELAPDRPGQ